MRSTLDPAAHRTWKGASVIEQAYLKYAAGRNLTVQAGCS